MGVLYEWLEDYIVLPVEMFILLSHAMAKRDTRGGLFMHFLFVVCMYTFYVCIFMYHSRDIFIE